MSDDFGAFLRSRRARLRPEEVGFAPGRGRRVPGLRREEVAALASVSVDYISRLEQGRISPSEAVLHSLARALQLEMLARMNWIASLHGDPGEIRDVDKQEFARRRKETADARAAGRNRYAELHPGSAEGSEGRGGSWDYLTALLETGTLYFDDIGLGLRL